MILNMQSIYGKYLNKANKTNIKHDEICISVLEVEQKFYISNKKREQTVSLLQQQIIRVKRDHKMIDKA